MKKHLSKLVMLALALTMVTTTLMSGTLAKYTTTVTGTGTAAVAKWSFKADQANATATDTFTFTLASTKTANTNVAAEAVAPGDTGKIDIKIDATTSQVGVDYSITLAKTELATTGGVIKFYSDEAYQSEISSALTGKIVLANVGTAVTVPIYWKWVSTGDVADTTLGAAAASETFTITVVGSQTVA